MANQQLITEKLPQDLHQIAQEFTIPEKFLVERTDLVILVLRSRSLDKKEEKQSWFNLMPMMNEEQIAKLNDILVRESQKLSEIEKKYEEKKVEIKKKYLLRWQNMWYIKKISDIQNKEAEHRKDEVEEAESLLSQI